MSLSRVFTSFFRFLAVTCISHIIVKDDLSCECDIIFYVLRQKLLHVIREQIYYATELF